MRDERGYETINAVLMTADGVGGVWTYALDLAREYASRGIVVHIAQMGPPLSDEQRAAARHAGARLIESSYRLEWMDDPWKDVAAAGQWLLGLERALRPDVVHLNGYCHGALPWRAPVVVVAHSCVLSWWRAVHGAAAPAEFDHYRRLVAAGLSGADLVVAPTDAMGTALGLEYGGVPRARVIPNGRAPVQVRATREPFVFAAGRVWDAAKNIVAVSSAAPELDWPVYVAGESAHAGSPDLPPANVQLLGRLSSAAMREWYARASIYVLPARYEPFGLSVLEAAQAGCALVLGDIPSLRENWSDAALFVDPGDRDTLVSAVNRLSRDRDRRRQLSRRARSRSRRFTARRMAGAYLAAYAELRRGRAASRRLTA